MKSLIKYISEKLVINQRFDEKLIINKDYKNADIDFYNDFKEDIDSLFKDGFFDEFPGIELCMYPKYRWSKSLRKDVINSFNKNGNAKKPCYKGIAWQHSSNPVNKEACKVWEKFIKYIKDNKNELDLLICNDGFTCYKDGVKCVYIINTDKALILLDGDTDIYYSEFSDGYVIIQYK